MTGRTSASRTCVTTFALIHGGGDVGWYWHLVERELRQSGHDTLAPDLIPAPGEAPGDWPANTGFDEVMARQQQRYSGADLIYQDVPPALAGQARRNARDQSDTPGRPPWPLDAWPPVATRFVLCTEDRFFPPDFTRRVAADRQGVVPDEIAAGHAVALSRPKELASLLVSYLP